MISISIKIENLDKLRSNVASAPALTLKVLAKAVKASIYEIEKNSVDRNFQFKTPRPLRTGDLQKSFAFGRYIAPNGLSASIGPTVLYAPYVYFGTSRGIAPNPFMDRIARESEGPINKYFDQAVDLVADHIAK